MNKYVNVYDTITYNQCVNNSYILSPHFYMGLDIENRNLINVRDFLSSPLYKGSEVGSFNYIDKSSYYFIRTSALQRYSYILIESKESFLPILKNSFIDMNLKKGDIIISKDGNIGEIIILDKDYNNCMLSGALYKLSIKEELKYYFLAMVKHSIFREQLDFLTPRGVTLRHSKTLFLDCKIPIPNYDKDNTIRYVSTLMQQIVKKQSLIKEKHNRIMYLIEKELIDNQKEDKFIYSYPKFNDMKENSRIDAKFYEREFQESLFKIKNYRYGYFYIPYKYIKSGNTPSIRYIDNFDKLKYLWVTPSDINNYGILQTNNKISFYGRNNLISDCILIINRGGIEDIGISTFYSCYDLGKGHHNQGLYQVSNSFINKLFVLCCLNSNLYRKICYGFSTGSKMKELKAQDISLIPFPNFPQLKQDEITSLYYSDILYMNDNLTIDNFTIEDDKYNLQAGIYNLDKSVKHLQVLLDDAIECVIKNEKVFVRF